VPVGENARNEDEIVLITLFVFSVASFTVSGASYAANSTPTFLNSTLCTSIGGTWTAKTSTCTITSGEATSSFVIHPKSSLDITGTLMIDIGVTITNSGTITIENDAGWGTDNFGTLANAVSGVITIKNTGDDTSIGIVNDYHNFGSGHKVVGFLTNIGIITIEALSTGSAVGIGNGGSFTNDNSGTLNNNRGSITDWDTTPPTGTCGIVNEQGTMINYGTIFNPTESGGFYNDAGTMLNYGTYCGNLGGGGTDNMGTYTPSC
jgi:hypothetical protein